MKFDRISVSPHGKYWQLNRDFHVEAGGRIWHVPKGFVYDGASIPWWAWALIGHPGDGRFAEAAALHDWLYESHQVSRSIADAVFLELLLRKTAPSDGAPPVAVPKWKANIMWAAVRVGGRGAWRRETGGGLGDGPDQPEDIEAIADGWREHMNEAPENVDLEPLDRVEIDMSRVPRNTPPE